MTVTVEQVIDMFQLLLLLLFVFSGPAEEIMRRRMQSRAVVSRDVGTVKCHTSERKSWRAVSNAARQSRLYQRSIYWIY